MTREDLELMTKIPELKYEEEFLKDSLKLSPRTIYGKIRMFSFRVHFTSGKSKTIEKCLRLANIEAIKNTWSSFSRQGEDLKLDLLGSEEIDNILKNKEKNE